MQKIQVFAYIRKAMHLIIFLGIYRSMYVQLQEYSAKRILCKLIFHNSTYTHLRTFLCDIVVSLSRIS